MCGLGCPHASPVCEGLWGAGWSRAVESKGGLGGDGRGADCRGWELVLFRCFPEKNTDESGSVKVKPGPAGQCKGACVMVGG